jgi:hypothetical protein
MRGARPVSSRELLWFAHHAEISVSVNRSLSDLSSPTA